MSVNSSRGMNANLAEGGTDGKYKKVATRDRGGVIDAATQQARSQLDDLYYGIHEAKFKTLPDGTVHETPDFVATPAPDMTRW